MRLKEEKNLAGCCGIYCGLCPRFQSTAKSRCSGCKILSLTISCKRYNCCVKAKGFVTCAECDNFPCEKYEGFFDWDSFVTHKVCGPNINRIKKVDLKKWLQEQGQRKVILNNLLANYNEGRSRSFYCTAVALMSAGLLKEAINKAKKLITNNKVADSDLKVNAKILKTAIENLASCSKIVLELRKKQK